MADMQAWDVYRASGVKITTVFYDKDCSSDYVREGLTNHDNYPNSIYVVKGARMWNETFSAR